MEKLASRGHIGYDLPETGDFIIVLIVFLLYVYFCMESAMLKCH